MLGREREGGKPGVSWGSMKAAEEGRQAERTPREQGQGGGLWGYFILAPYLCTSPLAPQESL